MVEALEARNRSARPEAQGQIIMKQKVMVDGRPMEVQVTLAAVALPEGTVVDATSEPVETMYDSHLNAQILQLASRLEAALLGADPMPDQASDRRAEDARLGASDDGSLSRAADAMLADFDEIMARVQHGIAAEKTAMDDLLARLAGKPG
jgi:hypothetical protein